MCTHPRTLLLAYLIPLLPCRLKDRNNNQERENEEILVTGSRNDLPQSCLDQVTNQFNMISVYCSAEKHLSFEVS